MPETIKGMFFNDVLKFIDEQGGPELREEISQKLGKPLKYVAFYNYPIQELVLIREEAIKKIYPHKTMAEGMYELGKVAYQTFARSLVGRVVFPYMKKDFKGMSARIPVWYKYMTNFGTIKVVDAGEKSFKIVYRDYRGYPEIDQGLIQQALDELGYKGTATLHITKMDRVGPGDITTDFELTVRWE